MDRLSAAFKRGKDNLAVPKVGFTAGSLADTIGFIGQPHVQALAVRFGVYRRGFDSHLTAGTDNANGDFASICDQHFMEHGGAPGARGQKKPLELPCSTGASLLFPDCPRRQSRSSTLRMYLKKYRCVWGDGAKTRFGPKFP